MEPRVAELLRLQQFEALAALLEHRWGFALPIESLRWLHEKAFSRAGSAPGGSRAGQWSESAWLTWIKHWVEEVSKNPSVKTEPGSRYGARFDVEQNPTSPEAWRSFLEGYSRELLESEELARIVDIRAEARDAGWLGFAPADETSVRAAELRLGRKLPISLRTFYLVSNGWQVTGPFVYDILPIEHVGWLRDLEPRLHASCTAVESEKGPFKNDPEGLRLREYQLEQGTRVKRSLVMNLEGDSSTWLLDPGDEPHEGEWPAGRWSSWNPAMEWYADSFADLMARELRSLRDMG